MTLAQLIYAHPWWSLVFLLVVGDAAQNIFAVWRRRP